MASPLIIPDVASLPEYEGRDLGTTKWHEIDQERIDAFAKATGDHQWIHVDRERAERESPFGGTIAHGYLTLALAPALLPELVEVENCSRIVNYGIEKLRLREPVPAGGRVRLGATIKDVRHVPGGAMRVCLLTRFEVEDAKRPACSGELVFVYFP
jgi:acyl dehydratase